MRTSKWTPTPETSTLSRPFSMSMLFLCPCKWTPHQRKTPTPFKTTLYKLFCSYVSVDEFLTTDHSSFNTPFHEPFCLRVYMSEHLTTFPGFGSDVLLLYHDVGVVFCYFSMVLVWSFSTSPWLWGDLLSLSMIFGWSFLSSSTIYSSFFFVKIVYKHPKKTGVILALTSLLHFTQSPKIMLRVHFRQIHLGPRCLG